MKKYSPILLMGYNRPAMLKASLEYLVKVDARIYVALDIPRSGDTTNEALSLECQRIVTDFSENLTGTRIAKESQGCFKGVTEAITWGFSLEPELIILEDDIRVSETFLTFATQMLKEYEGSNDVGSIAGTNLVPRAALTESESSIRFSAFTSSWGWATWRDRWDD